MNIIENQSPCTKAQAKETALERLRKLYGKENIILPYKAKLHLNEWEVFGTRGSYIAHVFVSRNHKVCSISTIKHEAKIYYLGGPPDAKSNGIVAPETREALKRFIKR